MADRAAAALPAAAIHRFYVKCRQIGMLQATHIYAEHFHTIV